ncbi:MAG: T9SS type A sorting domain-containing protein, partial [Ignavibacteria bacterium]|nr:T9SS type A sorting domain-containing protein [Ignavibacteria bacterium]
SSGWGTQFSSPFYFQTQSQDIQPPTLISPGSSSSPGPTISTLTPTFQWQSVSGAVGYGLYIRDMSTNTLVFDSDNSYPNGISGTSFTLPSGILQWGKSYRWNMRSRSSSGWGTQFSSPFYFQTQSQIQPPQITGVSPNPVIGSNNAVTMTISGSGFINGAKVTWRDKTFNDTYPDRIPKSISNTSIIIDAIFGTDPANWTVQVKNPDGQISNEFPFNVNAPLPNIESISPTSAIAGGPSFELTVNGNTFHRGSKVRWNGSERNTTPILDGVGKTIGLKAQILSSDISVPGVAQITVYSPGPGGGISNSVNFSILNTSGNTIQLASLWQDGDFWKPRTYDGHSSYGIYYAVDFYYTTRNRPDMYKNSDIGVSDRPIKAPISGDVFIHLLDVSSYGSGNFPFINAVRVFQGLDPIPKHCFSMNDSLGVTLNIDISLIIKFSDTERANFSHLDIKDQFFNQTVTQKIRDAIRKFYNRSAVGSPMRVAINTNSYVVVGSEIGRINKWGIASEPHLHFQIFRSNNDYSESNPFLGTPIDLSLSSNVLINNQKIFEYEGMFGNNNYHYPSMPRRKFTQNQSIVVNASWDGASGANLRDNPAGSIKKVIYNGTIGTIINPTPVVKNFGGNNYLWYNVSFGQDIGWMVAEYLDLLTGTEITDLVPKEFELFQNFPNPFNNITRIRWSSPIASHQSLKIYDILGNEIVTLIDEYREKGIYEIEFDASNMTSGIYYYSLRIGNFAKTKKMIVLK